MKLTHSAMTMLLRAYKAILSNCYVKENLTGGVKQFCKGVALSSFLTAVLAGVSTSSFAADQLPSTGPITSGEYENSGASTVSSDSSVIDTTGKNSGSVAIEITNGDLTLDGAKEKGHGIWSALDEGEKISITANDGSVSINSQGTDSGDNGDGVNLTEDNKGSISITAGESINITAESEQADGIYVAKESSGDVTFIANGAGAEVGNIFKVENNGIDHRGTQNILLKAENGVNSISAKNGDGLRNEGSGTIELDSTANEIISGDNGIQNSGSGSVIVNATNGDNNISGAVDGINATGGEVTVTASDENKISGKVNGVFAQGEKTKVTLTGGTNIIEIEDTEGSYIYGLQVNNNAEVDITSNLGDIELNLSTTGTHANGVSVGNLNNTRGEVRLTSEKNSVLININTGAPDATNGNVSGIQAQNQSNVTISAGKNIIITTNSSVVEQLPGAGANDVYGIMSRFGSLVKSDATGYLYINTVDRNSSNYGIGAQKDNANIKITTKGVNENNVGVLINSIGKLSHAAYTEDGQINLNATGDIVLSSTATETSRAVYNSSLTDSNAVVNITSNDGNIILTSKADGNYIETGGAAGIFNFSQSRGKAETLLSGKDITILATGGENIAYGILGQNYTSAEVNSVTLRGNNISITANSNNTSYGILGLNSNIDIFATGNTKLSSEKYGIYAYNNNNAVSTVAITSDGDNDIYGKYRGLYATGNNVLVHLNSNNGRNFVQSNSNVAVYATSGARIIIQAEKSYNQVSSTSTEITAYAIRSSGENSKVNISTEYGDNVVTASNRGILAQSDSIVSLSSTFGTNQITADNDYAIFGSGGNVELIAGTNNVIKGKSNGIAASSASVFADAKENNFISGNYGINAYSSSDIDVDADINNEIQGSSYGILTNTSATVDLVAGENNLIDGGDVSSGYGTRYAVYSYGASNVALNAGMQNSLLGAVFARDVGSSVTLNAKTNYVSSYATIGNAGDLNTDDAFKDKSAISALYAEQGANISLTGDSNILRTYAEYENDKQLERVVWAYNGKEGEKKGSSISIDGYSYISTDSYEKSPNSLDVAIAAGTATQLNFDKVNQKVEDDDRATVTVTYADIKDEEGKLHHSFISGDILAAYEGLIDITPKDGSAGITINGNLLAGNNGIVNVDLGQGGILTGRADDYGDAGVLDDSEHTEFFNPAFSSKIFKGGEVNLTMGEGSRWNVTGQSWITRINTENSSNAIIDLVSANTDRNETAHALTVYELTGNAEFHMSLDADRDVSDMLYIKNADGEYTVNVIDAVSHDDMYADGLDGLRFATVGAGSKAKFSAVTFQSGGVKDIVYQVGTDAYAGNEENSVYNGDSMSEHKPGDSTVDGFFENNGKPGEAIPSSATQTLSLAAVNVLAADSEVTVLAEEETAVPAAESGLDEVTNFKLVGVESSEISDAGKTIVDMSRANYANAVYMDTLNKRQGEARFVSDTDHGVWVRLRHDNIGKDDSFRTHDTMVEVGFDQRDIVDSGEFHTGFALDYMNGQIDYHTVDGDGDIERYGIWFYTTYLGNDGQYADLVLKYGHLKNDFDFNLDMTGVNVNGDYTNEVASISAEYGWKFSNSYNYYIEPQAQLQYSYVTGADYTTSYGTKVDLDSIHSLIGRIGFRAGKDFNTDTPITAYIRGDVLHEFLGDQDIYAYDNTGVMDVTYENDDTWYSAGLGISVQSSENTYFFLEGEQVFGADNDNTYTVSGGFKHSF